MTASRSRSRANATISRRFGPTPPSGRKGPVVDRAIDKVGRAVLVPLVGREPARLLLSLACGLDDEGLDPLDETRLDAGERPGAEQRLIEHIFVRRRGYL